jgi:pimeloyl-ACP methyl ester carboxylesterase
MIISYILYDQIFGRHPHENKKDDPISASTERLMGPDFRQLRDTSIDAREKITAMGFEMLEISSDDNLKLKAHFFRNKVPTDNTVILIHGHNSSGLKDNSIKGLKYLEKGFNVLTPDNRACGESEGKWLTFGYKESQDTVKWIEKIVQMYPDGKIIVDGCSLGGATVCMLADKDLPGNVKVLISDCAFVSVEDEFKYIFKTYAKLPPFPFYYLIEFWDKRLNHCSYKMQCPLDSVIHARVPMVFIHGVEDRYIPVGQAKKLYEACPTDKKLILIDGAGHASASAKGKDKYFTPVFEFIEEHM